MHVMEKNNRVPEGENCVFLGGITYKSNICRDILNFFLFIKDTANLYTINANFVLHSYYAYNIIMY